MHHRLNISKRARQRRLLPWSWRSETFWQELKTFKYAIWRQVVVEVLRKDLFQTAFSYPLWLSQLVWFSLRIIARHFEITKNDLSHLSLTRWLVSSITTFLQGIVLKREWLPNLFSRQNKTDSLPRNCRPWARVFMSKLKTRTIVLIGLWSGS